MAGSWARPAALRRGRSTVLGCLALAATLPAVADAHVGAIPEAIDLVAGPDGTESLETTFGLLVPEADGALRWLCHETVLAPGFEVTPRYVAGPDTRVATLLSPTLGRVEGEAVYVSGGSACDWQAAEGLTGRSVVALAADPDRGSMLAATADLEDGAVNGVRISEDGGWTWTDTDLAAPERLFRSLASSRGEGATAWAVASWFDPLGAWLYRSDDGGWSWTELALEFEVDGEPQVLFELLAADDERAWLRLDAAFGDYLMRTGPDGVGLEPVLFLEDELLDAAFDGQGRLWVATRYSGLWRSGDGVAFVADDPDDPLQVRAVAWHPDGLLVAPAYGSAEWLVGLRDEAGITPTVGLEDLVGPLRCPEGSSVEVSCAPLWQTLVDSLGLDPERDEPDEPGADDGAGSEADGCGCGADSDDAALAVLAPLLLVGVRRLRLPLRPHRGGPGPGPGNSGAVDRQPPAVCSTPAANSAPLTVNPRRSAPLLRQTRPR